MKGTFTESFGSGREIFAIPDHFLPISVVASDEGVELNENYRKIIPAGTIVGGIGGPVLQDQTRMVARHGPLSLTTALVGSDNDLIFVAKTTSTTSIAYVDPGTPNATLAVAVSGNAVTVNLGTDVNGNIETTANAVRDLINGNTEASAVMSADIAPKDNGTGIVTAMARMELTSPNGVTQAEGVLVNDVDVTHGPEPVAMAIHGFIERTRIPIQPTSEQEASMKLLMFINYKN